MPIRRTVEGSRLFLRDGTGALRLTIEELLTPPTALVKVTGSLDMLISHDFDDELTGIACMCSQITIDLSGTDSISSPALKTLLTVQQMLDRRENSRFVLRGLQEPVRKTFEETGYSALFEIERQPA